MSKSWYYVREGKQFGPIPVEVLQQLAYSGAITPDDKVRTEDMQGWARAGNVKGLFLEVNAPSLVPTVDGIGNAADAVSSVSKSTGKVVDAALNVAETGQKIGKAISTVASLATGGSTFAGSIGDFLRPLGPVNFLACGAALLSGLTFWILSKRATSPNAKRMMALTSIGLACVGGTFAVWTGLGAVAGQDNKGFLATHVKVLEQLQERTIAHRPKIGDVRQIKVMDTLSIPFAWVPPGQSWLGGGDGKEGETPFTLEKGFWCGIYEVTQEEWQAVMGYNPSYITDKSNLPVERVSYNNAIEFIDKLNVSSKEFGYTLKLPSEKEWDYILRGGPISKPQSRYNYYFARSKTDLTSVASNDLSSTQANFDGNYPAGSGKNGPYLKQTSTVGDYIPNPLGIYDMHGNVWEWTSTKEGSDLKYFGGGWLSSGDFCTASYWNRADPGHRVSVLGFRLLAVPVGE
jgi:hypothetical protein